MVIETFAARADRDDALPKRRRHSRKWSAVAAGRCCSRPTRDGCSGNLRFTIRNACCSGWTTGGPLRRRRTSSPGRATAAPGRIAWRSPIRMSDDVESVLRAAGAHSFLPLAGQSGISWPTALERLLQESVRTVEASAAITASREPPTGTCATLEMPAESVRPP